MPVINCHIEGCAFATTDVGDAVGATILAHHLGAEHPPHAAKAACPDLSIRDSNVTIILGSDQDRGESPSKPQGLGQAVTTNSNSDQTGSQEKSSKTNQNQATGTSSHAATMTNSNSPESKMDETKGGQEGGESHSQGLEKTAATTTPNSNSDLTGYQEKSSKTNQDQAMSKSDQAATMTNSNSDQKGNKESSSEADQDQAMSTSGQAATMGKHTSMYPDLNSEMLDESKGGQEGGESPSQGLEKTANSNFDQAGNQKRSSEADQDQARSTSQGQAATKPNNDQASLDQAKSSSSHKTSLDQQRSSAGVSSKIPIVAIGNPGGGKSTILNSIAGKPLFKSGISLGSGLTSHLDIKESNGQRFIDTPGVADEEYRDAAGDALTKVFQNGGKMKILFFITQQTGRVVFQDIATMKLVLESVPEIGRNYGIIVNKVPGNLISQLSEKENLEKFLLTLYTGIGDEFKQYDNILLIPSNDKLNNLNNVLVDPVDIHPSLLDFIDSIPEAQITRGRVTKVHVNEFDRLKKKIEDLESKFRNSQKFQNDEKEKFHFQLQDAARVRKEQKKDKKRYTVWQYVIVTESQ